MTRKEFEEYKTSNGIYGTVYISVPYTKEQMSLTESHLDKEWIQLKRKMLSLSKEFYIRNQEETQ